MTRFPKSTLEVDPWGLRSAYRMLTQARSASSRQRVVTRVATRWVEAYMDAAYDLFFRLQILEGAAGVPVDTWWRKGKQALPMVHDKFQGVPLAPGWTDPGNTGMYKGLQSVVGALIKSTGISSTTDEIMDNALMGLSIDPTEKKQIKRPAYEVGRYLAPGINSGKETPEKVSKGPLRVLMNRRILTEARNQESTDSLEQETDDGSGSHTRDLVDHPTKEGGDLLGEILFQDILDPLGREIRMLMRRSWRDTPEQAFMDKWLDIVEGEHRFPSKSQVGDYLGFPRSSRGWGTENFTARFWLPAWRRFFNILWKDQQILRKLEERYQHEGVPWFLEKPNLNDILPKRKSALISRVASKYLASRF